MPQVNLAGLAGHAGGDGVAATEPGEGTGADADAGADAGEVAAGEDSRLQPPSAAQASAAAPRRAATLIAERSATAGSIRTVTLLTGSVQLPSGVLNSMPTTEGKRCRHCWSLARSASLALLTRYRMSSCSCTAGGCAGTRSGTADGTWEHDERTRSMTDAGVCALNCTTASCLPNALSNEEQPAARVSAAAAAPAAAIRRRACGRRACTAASIGRPWRLEITGSMPQAPGRTPRGREAPQGFPGAEDQRLPKPAKRPRGRQTT